MEEDAAKSQADPPGGFDGMMDVMSFSSSEDEEQDETAGPSAVETAMAVNFVAQMPLTSAGNPMELLLDSSSSSEEEE